MGKSKMIKVKTEAAWLLQSPKNSIRVLCNDLQWPSVSGEAFASGSSSAQNTNTAISVTQQQEVGCP